jgi:TctA family transporter
LLGLLLAMVGLDNVTNQERFTFGLLELRDGLELVPVILGLFAVAEMFELWVSGGSLTGESVKPMNTRDTQRQVFRGMLEASRRPRSSPTGMQSRRRRARRHSARATSRGSSVPRQLTTR